MRLRSAVAQRLPTAPVAPPNPYWATTARNAPRAGRTIRDAVAGRDP